MKQFGWMRSAKRLFLFVAAFVGMAAIARSAEGPVGDWDLKMDMQGNAINAKLTITKNADGSLAGVWSGQRGESKLSDVKYDNGTLKFSRKLDLQGQSMDLPFEGKVEGDKLTGKVTSQMGDMQVTGARAAAATGSTPAKPAAAAPAAAPAAGGARPAAAAGGIVGVWNIVSTSQLGELKRKMTVKPDMTAKYDVDGKEYDVKNLKVAGDDVTFEVSPEIQGNVMALSFKGKLEGSKLTGEYSSDGAAVAQVKAEKAGAETKPAGDAKPADAKPADAKPATGGSSAAPAAKGAIVGKWDVSVNSQAGEGQKRVLVINPDMTGTYTVVDGGAKFDVKDLKVDGENVTFGVPDFKLMDQPFALKFEGKLTASGIEGKFTFEGGEATLTAKKAAN